MKVKFSKSFKKSVKKLSGNMLLSVKKTIQEVIDAKNIEEIPDCKKLTDFENVYRIRISTLRAFFIYIDKAENETVNFQYLVPRGEAYNKKTIKSLRDKDKK